MALTTLLTVLLLIGTAVVVTKDEDLRGKHFRIAVSEQIGSATFHRSANGTIIGYSGAMIELLKWLSQRLKFTYTLIPDFLQLEPLPNGTYIGVLGMLREKKVDFAFTGLTMVTTHYQFVDYTLPVHEAPDVLLLPLPKEESRALATIKPFTLTVWILLLGTLLLISLVLNYCIGCRTQQKTDVFSLLQRNVQLILGQGGFESFSIKPIKIRIALCGWLLAALIFVNCYTSSFISYATAPKLLPQPKTFTDLAYKSELQPIVIQNLFVSVFSYFPNDSASKVLDARVRENPQNTLPNIWGTVERVSSGCCVFIYPKFGLEILLLRDLKKTGKCRCSMTNDAVLWEYFAIGTHKNSPYTTLLSKEILVAKEMGLIQYWMMAVSVRPYKCLVAEKSKTRPLTIHDLSGAFIILICGVSISIAVFAAEVLKMKLTSKKRKSAGSVRIVVQNVRNFRSINRN